MLKRVIRILVEAFDISESLSLDVMMVLWWNKDIITNVIGYHGYLSREEM